MKRIIIITGSELRHEYFRKYLALSDAYSVVKSYCEYEFNSIRNVVETDRNNFARLKHLVMREETEKDFFQLFCTVANDKSNPEHIKKGEINLPSSINSLINLKPDLIITYGCSILQPPLIEAFNGRIINIHLGLSPYYRGSGTNFWPFVNNEPEYTGATFMYMDAGIDTGAIIHQMQANIYYGDNIHQIGNRLIRDMAKTCSEIIKSFDHLEPVADTPTTEDGKYYRNKDFTEDAVARMYQNFSNGLIEAYLADLSSGKRHVKLVINPALQKKTVCT